MLTLGMEYLILLIIGVSLGYYYAISANKKTCEENDMATVILIHEIRSQLTGLKWIFNLFSEKNMVATVDEDSKKLIEEGDKKIASALEIVNDTFNIVKLGERSSFKPEKNNLETIVKKCIEEYKIHANQRNVTIKMSVVGNLSEIVFDKLKMTQVLKNIIGNAIKYSNISGEVNIALERLETLIRIIVTDNGIGIPADDQPKLFTKFFRAKNAENLSGSGLGLYIARDLIARHGGRIEVESTEGNGSRFTITFPIK
ncbi:MAG: HAMP domain-containing histidine kinase [Candidatus Vogelbacteria bacterium]|nr:HAMP domain-containing histidine kinase [Candidatus Vogelbacteria bacterium]